LLELLSCVTTVVICLDKRKEWVRGSSISAMEVSGKARRVVLREVDHKMAHFYFN
jgi:hypothetical protein